MFISFFLDCPCNFNCPNGCNDCPNPICVCGGNASPQNEDNLKQCKNEKSINLGQCIIDCKDDQSCEQSCVSFFKVQYDQCPCQVKIRTIFDFYLFPILSNLFKEDCPFGCPCDSFDCQPDKKSVLVLNTSEYNNKPVLIKFDGKLK